MAAAKSAHKSGHNHGALLTAGAGEGKPDTGIPFVFVFEGDRTVRGIATVAGGLALEKHPDDPACPDNPLGNSQESILSQETRRECPYRIAATQAAILLAQEMGYDTLRGKLISNEVTVALGDIGVPNKTPDEFPWFYAKGAWTKVSQSGVLDLSSLVWGAIEPEFEDELGPLIPEPVPGYHEHPHLMRSMTMVALALPQKIIGVVGPSGSGKTSGIRQWCALKGAPFFGPIGVNEDTTSDILIGSDRGLEKVGEGPLAKYLAMPCVTLVDEFPILQMAGNADVFQILDAQPGTPVPITRTQGSFVFKRHERAVFAWTGNQGAKHVVKDMGFAFMRRSTTINLKFSDAEFLAAAKASLEVDLGKMAPLPGAELDVIKDAARQALEEVWGPMFLWFRRNDTIVNAMDISPSMASVAAMQTPFMGYAVAFETLVTKVNDPYMRMEVIDQVKSEPDASAFAGYFESCNLTLADF